MESDRQRRRRGVGACHNHHDGFRDEMLLGECRGQLVGGGEHVFEHGPRVGGVHLSECSIRCLAQRKKSIGDSGKLVVTGPPESRPENWEMLKLCR